MRIAPGVIAITALLAASAPAVANVSPHCSATGTTLTLSGFPKDRTTKVDWGIDGITTGVAYVRGTSTVEVALPDVAPWTPVTVRIRWWTGPSDFQEVRTHVRCVGPIPGEEEPPPLVPPTAPEPPTTPPPDPTPAELPPTPAPPLDELGPPDAPPVRRPAKARQAPLPRATVCRTWTTKPSNGVARGVPRPGQVRVRYVEGRWYGFRGDRFERVRVRGRVVVAFRPGVPCFRVVPEVTG